MKATVRRYLRAAGSILDIAPSTDYVKIAKEPLAPIHCVVISDALAEILDAQLH